MTDLYLLENVNEQVRPRGREGGKESKRREREREEGKILCSDPSTHWKFEKYFIRSRISVSKTSDQKVGFNKLSQLEL